MEDINGVTLRVGQKVVIVWAGGRLMQATITGRLSSPRWRQVTLYLRIPGREKEYRRKVYAPDEICVIGE